MKTLLCVLLLLVGSHIAYAQDKVSGDPAEVKSSIMNSNNIRYSLYNYGSVTRPSTGNDFVWRGLGYMYEFAPLLSAEVVNAPGETLRIVDDGLWLSSQGDYSPAGLKWGWLPRAGYARTGQPNLATSNNPASWPAAWSQWPGESGGGAIGQDEAYFVMDDFTNAEFPYYPFPADSTKRGLGVSCEMRVYQFGGGLSDAVIIKYKLKNESPKPLNRCYFGFYVDPHIGGANSFNDDLTNIVPASGPQGDTSRANARNTMYTWDVDGVGEGGLPTGYLSFKFLQTPQNRDITAFRALLYGGPNFPANDQLFYSLMSATSIDTNQTLFHSPGDIVLVSGSGPFSMMAGDSTTFVVAVFLSENYQDMIDDANYIADSNHVTGVVQKEMIAEYRLFANYPNPFNPNTRIHFQIPKSGNVSLKVFDILGREVATLVNENRIEGSYVAEFDASNLASGIYFYRLQSGSFISTKKMILLR